MSVVAHSSLMPAVPASALIEMIAGDMPVDMIGALLALLPRHLYDGANDAFRPEAVAALRVAVAVAICHGLTICEDCSERAINAVLLHHLDPAPLAKAKIVVHGALIDLNAALQQSRAYVESLRPRRRRHHPTVRGDRPCLPS
jgi:hypothetical protein